MINYEFYVQSYHGSAITADEWPAAEREASATLDRYKRIYTVTALAEDAEKMAVCAMAEVLVYHARAEVEALTSAAIGSVSVSYASTSSVDHSSLRRSRDLYQSACMYLDIYRGVC